MSAMILAFPNATFPVIKDGVRTENTAIGTFKAYVNESMNVVSPIEFSMKLPKLGMDILYTIIREFKKDVTKEAMLNVYWSVCGQYYYIARPLYTADKVSVNYTAPKTKDVLVLQAHSHNTMPAVFSSTDNEDECMTGLYMVLGRLHTDRPQVNLRCGMEGTFTSLRISDVFSDNSGDIA